MKEDCDQCLLPNVDVLMRSETPRTEYYILNPHPEAVPAAFARDLERELAASKAEVERLRGQLQQAVDIADKALDCLIPVFRGKHEELEAELKQLKETIK